MKNDFFDDRGDSTLNGALAYLYRQGLDRSGQENLQANALRMLGANPVEDVKPKEFLDAQAQVPVNKILNNTAQRSQFDMVSDFPFLLEQLPEFQEFAQKYPDKKDLFLDIVRSGQEAQSYRKQRDNLTGASGLDSLKVLGEVNKQQLAQQKFGMDAEKHQLDLQKGELDLQKGQLDIDLTKQKAEAEKQGAQKKAEFEGMGDTYELPQQLKNLPDAVKEKLKPYLDKIYGDSFVPGWGVVHKRAYGSTDADQRSKRDLLELKLSSDDISERTQDVLDYMGTLDRIPVNWADKGGAELQFLIRLAQMYSKDKGGFNLGVLNGRDLEVLETILIDPTGAKALALGKDRITHMLGNFKRTVMARRDRALYDKGIGTLYMVQDIGGRTHIVPSWQTTDIYRKWTQNESLTSPVQTGLADLASQNIKK